MFRFSRMENIGVGSFVMLRDQYAGTHGHGVFGNGFDQTNMATVVAIGPIQFRLPEDSVSPRLLQIHNGEQTFLDVEDDRINVGQGHALVQSGDIYSVYPIEMIEIIPEEQNNWENNMQNMNNNRSTIVESIYNNTNTNMNGGRRHKRTKTRKQTKKHKQMKKRTLRRKHRTRK